MNLFKTSFLALAAIGLLSGCASGRGAINITQNIDAQVVRNANGNIVVIDEVTDSRVFETAPKDPSLPSIDPGNSNLSEIQSTLIARKRNGFGKALGDIVTHDKITVPSYFRGLVTNSLNQAGYSVVPESTDPNAIHMKVDVKQFWGWLTPGFWTVAVSTRTELEITASQATASKQLVFKLNEESTSRGMKASTSNWTKVFKINATKVKAALAEDFKSKLPTIKED